MRNPRNPNLNLANRLKIRHPLLLAALVYLLAAIAHAQTPATTNAAQIQLDRSIQLTLKKLRHTKKIEEAAGAHAAIHELFEQFVTDASMKGASICESLLKLTPRDLTFFDEEISEHDSAEYLKDCHDQLNSKISAHWSQQAQLLPNRNGLLQPVDDSDIRPFEVIHRPLTENGAEPYKYGDYRDKEVTLTFDDGPRATTTPKILATLRKYGAKAIFFNLGNHAQAHPELSREILLQGHSLGSHSWDHPDEAKVQRTQGLQIAQSEIIRGHIGVFEATGMIANFFRFPYGSDTPELKEFLRNARAYSFRWNMDSNDWNTPDVNKLINQVKTMFNQHRKGVILMHDIQPQTAMALPYILQYLQDQGYTLVLPVVADPSLMTDAPPIIRDQPDYEYVMTRGASSRSRLASPRGYPLP